RASGDEARRPSSRSASTRAGRQPGVGSGHAGSSTVTTPSRRRMASTRNVVPGASGSDGGCGTSSVETFQTSPSRRRCTTGATSSTRRIAMPSRMKSTMLYSSSSTSRPTTVSPSRATRSSCSCTPPQRPPSTRPMRSCPLTNWAASRIAYRRSQSRNHEVCDTRIASTSRHTRIAVRIPRARSVVRMARMSERLPYREVDAPVPRLGLATHDEAVDGRQLVPEVETHGPDRRGIADPRARVHAQRAEVDVAASPPHVAGVNEADEPQALGHGNARLDRRLEQREATDRQAGVGERADVVAAPATEARRAAQEVPLEEWHVAVPPGINHGAACTRRQHDPAGDGAVRAHVAGKLRVGEVAWQPAAGALDGKGERLPLPGVERVEHGAALQLEPQADERPLAFAGLRVEAQRDELRAV